MKPPPLSARTASLILASFLFVAGVLIAGCRSDRAVTPVPDTSSAAPASEPLPLHDETAPTGSAATPDTQPDADVPVAAVPVPALGSTPVESAQIIGQAYRELTTRLFKEVQPSVLLSAGWRGVADELRRQGQLGADQLTAFSLAGSADIDGFMREFSLFVTGPGAGLDSGRLAQAAIRGMTASVGDSHTRYVPPQQAQSQSRDGSYSGIGVVTSDPRIDGGPGLMIREVYSGSPAEQAGVRAGERIIRVNGTDIGNRSQVEVSEQIRGDAGTTVSLTLIDELGRQREVAVNRARILPPVITSRMLEGQIGYLKVAQFPRRTAGRDAAADFESAMTALQTAGARAFVLDLRGNPGGDPFTSVDIASNFVQDGPIFVAIDRTGRRTVYPANTNRTLVNAPAVVLIDAGSASGAEVVASALSEYGAAYLIGQTSCGCLSVGQPTRLEDRSEIVITVQQAVTGKLERSLEGRGLDPDEVVRSPRLGGPDTQLDRAVEYLQAKLQ
jgi:carboxyl-terminal processing protease